MLLFYIFLPLLTFRERQVISAERNEICEAMVIQECSDHSQGLLKALEGGNQRLLIEQCAILQASDAIYAVRHVDDMTRILVFHEFDVTTDPFTSN